MKKLIVLCMTFILILSQTGLIAAEDMYKEESVYGILNADGSPQSVYVVNALHQGTVDYGTYDRIENLSTLEELIINGDEIQIPSTSNTFYYQGIIEKPLLPWTFNMEYTLDGKPITSDKLAGASGELNIHITVRQGDILKESFYNGYALQIGLSLSDELTSHVTADGATLVEVGGNKQIAYTVLPGNDADFTIGATVQDFVMDPITINAVKMVFDMSVDTSSFTDQIDELTTAITQLDVGAIALLKGLNDLSDGLTTYNEGLKAYNVGMQAFATQGKTLSSGLQNISVGMNTLTAQNTSLKAGIAALEAGTFKQIDSQLAAMGVTLPALTKENYKQILSGQEALAPILMQLEQSLQLTTGLTAYVDGAGQLAVGTSDLSKGLTQYVQGADQLATSANKLYEGTVSIQDGLVKIKDGMKEYQSGTSTFRTSTKDIKPEMQTQIDSLLNDFTGKNSETISFVSSKNTSIQSVQFFFRTQGIKLPEAPKVSAPVEKKTTFWQRLLKLFGL